MTATKTTGYVKGKRTVLLNISATVLHLGIKTVRGGFITLHPLRGRNYVDIEQMCEEQQITAYKYDFEDMEEAGKIEWHPRGSKPVWKRPGSMMKLPQAEGETVIAPPNVYDGEINKLIEKEKKEDEKTKASSTSRDLTRRTHDVTDEVQRPPAPIAREREVPETARLAGEGEVDAGDPNTIPAGVQPDPGELHPRATTPANPFLSMAVGELVDKAIEANILTKRGTYLCFEEETIANGKVNTCEALEQPRSGLRIAVAEAMNKHGG